MLHRTQPTRSAPEQADAGVPNHGWRFLHRERPPRWLHGTIHTCVYVRYPQRLPQPGHLACGQPKPSAGHVRGPRCWSRPPGACPAPATAIWSSNTWPARPAEQQPEPVAALLALARGHAVYCRRDVARVMMALRVEFSGQDHPVGREIKRVSQTLMKRCARLIEVGRNDGSIPPGPPATAVALAFWGALEGAVIALAGQAPHDELLTARAVAGVLGLDRPPVLPSPELVPRASGDDLHGSGDGGD